MKLENDFSFGYLGGNGYLIMALNQIFKVAMASMNFVGIGIVASLIEMTAAFIMISFVEKVVVLVIDINPGCKVA